jgi:hypothetical protein
LRVEHTAHLQCDWFACSISNIKTAKQNSALKKSAHFAWIVQRAQRKTGHNIVFVDISQFQLDILARIDPILFHFIRPHLIDFHNGLVGHH